MERRKVLIVDGYNVIRNNTRYSSLGIDHNDDAWNHAREALINDAATFAKGAYESCTVVFDGAGNEFSQGKPTHEAGVAVVFSPHTVSADTVIEQLAHDAREKGLEVVVVSSDFTIQSTVFGGGVTRMSANSFGIISATMEDEWRDSSSAKHSKSTVANRIDPEVAAKLSAWVRAS